MWQERLNEFVTLLLVVSPFTGVAVFLAITGKLEPGAPRKVAFVAVTVSFALLTFFIFAGSFLLKRLGISITAFQISGGILLFLFGLSMVHGVGDAPSDRNDDQSPLTLAIYPLAIPAIAGPGSMLTVVLLTDDDRYSVVEQLRTVGVVAAVMVIQWVMLLAANPISRIIGAGGAAILARVMGVLLAALAVNIVLNALVTWLNLPKL
jgi:multiple antibiotic resistance protein